MKALKITLMLAVFCLTVSGSSYETSKDTSSNAIQKMNNEEFKMVGPISKKNKLPGQRI
ncbi:hypothetical protein N9R53_01340 [Flavobacteriaceae bacterium]|jgi:hypothetical protein|nr:hypothetical protein [Bacteroidota bacterium]MDA9551554.1 hypothetical protein [Flavobacteriaceae bacterium]MDC0956490.1 hypothetical protein [Flavobacteriaceae bacterium]MDG1378728.1 hypothetical protein [Flavobacteriaceae bacterium]MDG2349620.1 hypothetical protein [Flavobacteriaceae bacterium]|tara:strand:- start:20477 stop:20653 length:177 start_codon:yes stop_codon:yes gene_type:complete